MSDVSVVMATYNGIEHVEEQIQSIVEQSTPPAEIIVADDQSSDGTFELIQRIAATSTVPISAERNEVRLGYSENFLRATQRAGQPFIAFSDQDDVWHPEKLSRQRKALEQYNAVLCTHQVVLMTETGAPIRLDSQEIKATRVLELHTGEPFGVYFGFTMMFDRRLLDLVPFAERGPDNYSGTGVLPHDRWVYFLATTFGRRVELAESLSMYRQHERQEFGVKPVSLRHRFANKVAEGAPRLEFLADLAGQRASLLRRHCEIDVENGWIDASGWTAAINRWDMVEDSLRHRILVHYGNGVLKRVSLLASNVRGGIYRDVDRGGLGRKRMLEDSSVGLFFSS